MIDGLYDCDVERHDVVSLFLCFMRMYACFLSIIVHPMCRS